VTYFRLKSKEDAKQKFSYSKATKNEVHAFVNSITNGQVPPIPVESLISTTLTSFKAIESLQKGGAVAVVF
jgi:hypothetical protein